MVAHEVGVVRACVGRLAEAHILTGQQFLTHARFERGNRLPASPVTQRHPGELVFVPRRRSLGDEHREKIGEALTLKHVVVEVSHTAQASDDRSHLRHAAQLPRSLRVVDVAHELCGHAHDVLRVDRKRCIVTGVSLVHPVGHAPPDTVNLDAGANHVADLHTRPVVGIEHGNLLRLDQLDLHRDSQTIFDATGADSHEELTTTEPSPNTKRLQAVEVENAVRVSVAHPLIPKRVEFEFERGVLGQRARHNAGADQIGCPTANRRSTRPLVAPNVAGAVANDVEIRDRLVRAGGGGIPPLQPTTHARRLVTGLRIDHTLCARTLRHQQYPRPAWYMNVRLAVGRGSADCSCAWRRSSLRAAISSLIER